MAVPRRPNMLPFSRVSSVVIVFSLSRAGGPSVLLLSQSFATTRYLYARHVQFREPIQNLHIIAVPCRVYDRGVVPSASGAAEPFQHVQMSSLGGRAWSKCVPSASVFTGPFDDIQMSTTGGAFDRPMIPGVILHAAPLQNIQVPIASCTVACIVRYLVPCGIHPRKDMKVPAACSVPRGVGMPTTALV